MGYSKETHAFFPKGDTDFLGKYGKNAVWLDADTLEPLGLTTRMERRAKWRTARNSVERRGK